MQRETNGRFAKGRIETLKEKLKRIQAFLASWKHREDYIGDLIAEHPYIYNVWRSIRFTEKGKRYGCQKEWESFKTFYADVAPTYQDGYKFRRKDTTKPFSKDNFMWLSKEDSALLGSTESVIIEYEGLSLTIKEWATVLLCSVYAIRNRYFKHKNDYTVLEILYGKRIKRKNKLVKDYKASNMSIRQKASKMIASYKFKDKKLNLSECDIDIDWMIENIITKPCIYCGDTKRVGCDRINNDEGHVKTNVVPCCYDCNCARNNNFSYEEMLILGKTIAKIKNNRK